MTAIKPGRKSTASLTVARPTLGRGRPAAPAGLPDAAVDHWNTIISTCEADFFNPAELPLLAAYVRSLAAHDHARTMLEKEGPVRPDGKSSAWLVVVEKEVRGVCALAARLRLAPQSRIDRTTAGTRARPVHGPAPWETDEFDDLLAKSDDNIYRARAAR